MVAEMVVQKNIHDLEQVDIELKFVLELKN